MSTESPHMDKDTKVNVMPVDLAIQRELAYRDKVAKLQPDGDVDFMKNLLPIRRVQTCSPCHSQDFGPMGPPPPCSNPTLDSTLVQLPFSSPTPTPSLEPNLISSSCSVPALMKSSTSMQEPCQASSLRQQKPEAQAPISNFMVSNPSRQVPFANSYPKPPPSPNCMVSNPPNQIRLYNPNQRPFQSPNLVVSNPPNQIPTANSNPRSCPARNQFPRLKTCLPRRPTHLGLKRKATTGNVQYPPPRCPRPSFDGIVSLDEVGNFFCKACQVPCSGPLCLKQHLDGHKHKAKLQWLQVGKKDGEEQVSLTCDLCGIWCTDETSLESHLKGQKHMAKLHELEIGQGSSRQERSFCEVCQTWCMNEDALRQHLKGQKHSAKVNALNKKTRRNGI